MADSEVPHEPVLGTSSKETAGAETNTMQHPKHFYSYTGHEYATPRGHGANAISITVHRGKPGSVENMVVQRADLPTFMSFDPVLEDQSTFKMLYLDVDPANPNLLKDMGSMHLDPRILPLLVCTREGMFKFSGFARLAETVSSADADLAGNAGLGNNNEGAKCETFYLGAKLLVVVWSYHRPSSSTRAVLFGFAADSLQMLTTYIQSSIAAVEYPWFPTLFISPIVVMMVDEALQATTEKDGLGGIRCLGKTARGEWGRPDGHNTFIPKSRIRDSDKAGQQALLDRINRANNLRPLLHRLKVVQHVLQTLLDMVREQRATPELIFGDVGKITRSHSSSSGSELPGPFEPPLLGFQMLERHLVSRSREAAYLSSLATIEIETINSYVAHSNALSSVSLAQTAARDASAMKVVAIMTMAFLPATFIAALFAVPSLDWKGETVITSRFWIYWAFALPSTVLVFTIWAVLTTLLDVASVARWLYRVLSFFSLFSLAGGVRRYWGKRRRSISSSSFQTNT